jgi:hypothetical protein
LGIGFGADFFLNEVEDDVDGKVDLKKRCELLESHRNLVSPGAQISCLSQLLNAFRRPEKIYQLD